MSYTTNIKNGRYKVYVENGDVVQEVEGHNLILDNFMDKLLGVSPLDNLLYVQGGDGKPTPTSTMYEDSGVITATQSLTVVTSSAPFFNAGMEGKTIHFELDTDNDYDCKIVTFNSTTEVIVNTSNTVAIDTFAVWNTDHTELDSLHSTSDLVHNSSQGSRTISSFTHTEFENPSRIEFDWSILYAFKRRDYVTPDITVNEIGIGPSPTDLCVKFYLDSDVVIPQNYTLYVNYDFSISLTGIRNGDWTEVSNAITGANDPLIGTFIKKQKTGEKASLDYSLRNNKSASAFIFPWTSNGFETTFTYNVFSCVPTTFTNSSNISQFAKKAYSSNQLNSLTSSYPNSLYPQQWVKIMSLSTITGSVYSYRYIVVGFANTLLINLDDEGLYYIYDCGTETNVPNLEDTLDLVFTWTMTRGLPSLSEL